MAINAIMVIVFIAGFYKIISYKGYVERYCTRYQRNEG
jgi:hypothetical protein